jgi:PIN domain nuclease of toxin-antitoxin system
VILLDTHILIWADNGDPKLGIGARALIESAWAENAVAVSAITFWECALLHARDRIQLPTPLDEWRNRLLTAGLIELPIDGVSGIASAGLDGLHKDPADRFIAATALRYGATLITADERLLAWQHSLKRHNAFS